MSLATAWVALLTLVTPPQPTEATDGYWLSAELAGPAAGRVAAREMLAAGLDPGGRRDTQVRGVFVGYVAEPEQALAWIGRHAFDGTTRRIDPPTLDVSDAPVVGGRILDEHGVVLRAFVVTGATAEGGRRAIDWPTDPTEVLPDGTSWQAADLVVDEAPLFAAPAPVVPPASERHGSASRRGAVYVIGHLDRCRDRDDGRTCLRWAQVVARDGDVFVPGYLPAFQVAVRDAWHPDTSTLPRAALVRSGVRDEAAQWLLLARDRDGQLHRTVLDAPMTEDAFPTASLRVDGAAAIVRVDGAAERVVPIGPGDSDGR